MKTGKEIIWLCFLVITSCNIKEPLENILTEANREAAPLVQHRFNADTISLKILFPTLTGVDSVCGKGLKIVPLNHSPGSWMINVKDTTRYIHEIEVVKKGKKVSLLFYKLQKPGNLDVQLSITPNSYLNNRLLFRCMNRPDEFYVLWQNVALPDEFISFTRDGFSIFLPKDVRSMEHSLVRILAANHNGEIVYVSVPLAYGLPAPVTEWTIQPINR
ncbi:hypothetical protein [Parabacteroides sp. FAFU027]|uniref:hypothetical protein n=1 Tax=Parabacteroides sp. FAFU027 TaxID=2922715 RepID=UPI001FAF8199|nr:hypothetical protein [Parabacteroides sp. FAFU027]